MKIVSFAFLYYSNPSLSIHKYLKIMHVITLIGSDQSEARRNPTKRGLVTYLTQVSDLDLAPDPEQFVASPPVRYINSGCCVHLFQKSAMANNVFA